MILSIDWGKVLQGILSVIAKPLVEWALKKAYELAEEWAENLFKDSGEKPASEAKMALAAGTLTAMCPIEPAAARLLLEAHHLETKQRQGKTANA